MLTQIIEEGDYYDPEIRDFSLLMLENIFNLFNIPIASLKYFKNQVSINAFKVVFMIDYSKEMSIGQINLSHQICTQIFNLLQPEDLIGFYAFNDQLHEAFPL
jgi:hypothetical protein